MATTKKRKQRNQIPKGPHGGMQLVLTEDVQHLGKQGDVVEVKAGYGRNYLLPRGMATIPTAHNLRLLERYKIRVRQARDAKIADLRAMAEQILKMPGVTIEANANPEGHLYGSVAAPEIVKALRGKAFQIEADMVKLEGPIKETGLYEITLHLGTDMENNPIESKVKVAVIQAQEKK
jgi:large subunit ribosomal protein L9